MGCKTLALASSIKGPQASGISAFGGTSCTIDKRIMGEFNCSCVGISKCLPAYCKADTPNASLFDIPVKDTMMAT